MRFLRHRFLLALWMLLGVVQCAGDVDQKKPFSTSFDLKPLHLRVLTPSRLKVHVSVLKLATVHGDGDYDVISLTATGVEVDSLPVLSPLDNRLRSPEAIPLLSFRAPAGVAEALLSVPLPLRLDEALAMPPGSVVPALQRVVAGPFGPPTSRFQPLALLRQVSADNLHRLSQIGSLVWDQPSELSEALAPPSVVRIRRFEAISKGALSLHLPRTATGVECELLPVLSPPVNRLRSPEAVPLLSLRAPAGVAEALLSVPLPLRLDEALALPPGAVSPALLRVVDGSFGLPTSRLQPLTLSRHAPAAQTALPEKFSVIVIASRFVRDVPERLADTSRFMTLVLEQFNRPQFLRLEPFAVESAELARFFSSQNFDSFLLRATLQELELAEGDIDFEAMRLRLAWFLRKYAFSPTATKAFAGLLMTFPDHHEHAWRVRQVLGWSKQEAVEDVADPIHVHAALFAYQNGMFSLVVELAEKVGNEWPEHQTRMQLLSGMSKIATRNFTEAHNVLTPIAANDDHPDFSAEALFLLAWLHFQERRLSDARDRLKELVQRYPESQAAEKGRRALQGLAYQE